jgi:hypothetical protein
MNDWMMLVSVKVYRQSKTESVPRRCKEMEMEVRSPRGTGRTYDPEEREADGQLCRRVEVREEEDEIGNESACREVREESDQHS